MDKPLVIIVDGYRERALAVGTALAGDYECLPVDNAAEALLTIRELRPAAVVVDFPFPTDDRHCLSRVVSDDPATSDIPLVAFSSWDFAKTRAKSRALGCDAFVPRSGGPAAIADALAEVVGKKSRSAA